MPIICADRFYEIRNDALHHKWVGFPKNAALGNKTNAHTLYKHTHLAYTLIKFWAVITRWVYFIIETVLFPIFSQKPMQEPHSHFSICPMETLENAAKKKNSLNHGKMQGTRQVSAAQIWL